MFPYSLLSESEAFASYLLKLKFTQNLESVGGKGCDPAPTIPKWPWRGYEASLRMVGPTHVPYRHVEPRS